MASISDPCHYSQPSWTGLASTPTGSSTVSWSYYFCTWEAINPTVTWPAAAILFSATRVAESAVKKAGRRGRAGKLYHSPLRAVEAMLRGGVEMLRLGECTRVGRLWSPSTSIWGGRPSLARGDGGCVFRNGLGRRRRTEPRTGSVSSGVLVVVVLARRKKGSWAVVPCRRGERSSRLEVWRWRSQ